jgi:hypothetical protein
MFLVRFGFGGFRWCSLSRVGDAAVIDEGGDSVEARAVLATEEQQRWWSVGGGGGVSVGSGRTCHADGRLG